MAANVARARRAAPKKAAAPAKDLPPAEDPHTIPVPGGTATFWDPVEIPVRRSREVDILREVLSDRLRRLTIAQTITVDGEPVDTSPVLDGPAVELTAADRRDLAQLTDAAIFGYLKSWTVDRTLPSSEDDVADLPSSLHAALAAHAVKLLSGRVDGDVDG